MNQELIYTFTSDNMMMYAAFSSQEPWLITVGQSAKYIFYRDSQLIIEIVHFSLEHVTNQRTVNITNVVQSLLQA